MILVWLCAFCQIARGVDQSVLKQKCLDTMKLAGLNASHADVSVEPLEQRDSSGTLVSSGWQANCNVHNVIVRFDEQGALSAYVRMVTPREQGPAISMPVLWTKGEVFVNSLRGSGYPLRRAEETRYDDDPRFAQIQEVRGQVRLDWVEAKDDRPNAATTTVLLDAASGEPIWYVTIASKKYGPSTPTLSPEEARMRLGDLIEQVTELKPEYQTSVKKALASFDGIEPELAWSRGGGGFGLYSARKYFLDKEMRLGYAWESDFGSAEVDAATGELLSLNVYSARTGVSSSVTGSPQATLPASETASRSSPGVVNPLLAVGGATLIGGFLFWRLRKWNRAIQP